jgi:putative ABC transport system permease protein
MLRNYFKVAWRNLIKQKMYSVIKIGGFALGISACLLIALYISNELSYDRSYENADRIYRLVGEERNNGKVNRGVSMPAPMTKVLKSDFPEVEMAGRLMSSRLFPGAGSNEIRREDQVENSYEEGFCFADQEILDIFSIPMIYGDRSKALAAPFTMVISKRKADKYFPGENPVGKVLFLNDNTKMPVTIGGVMENFPATSHLQYDFLLSLAGTSFWDGEQATWMASNYDCYLLLRPGTDIPQFENKLTADVLANYMLPAMQESGNKIPDGFMENASLRLQPVSDIHLKSYDIDDSFLHGDIRFVWLFGAIASFILLIAAINFINLSTAKSANRAKEVGLRKVVGSLRSHLVKQFLAESILFSFISFGIGIFFTALFLPYFNSFAGKSLTIPWEQWWLVPTLFLSAIFIGGLAGIYPSWYLSSFKPIDVLKRQLSRGSRNSTLRNGLVVFQFSISIILIIGTVIIFRQVQFILNREAGFDKEQVMLIQATNSLGTQVHAFKTELKKLPGVRDASISDYLPVSGSKRNGNTFWKEGKTSEEAGTTGQYWVVDGDYINTMGMKIVEGRNFSFDFPGDSQSVVINQTLAKNLGLTKPIGARITNGWATYNVVGVVQDFNFESVHDPIAGLCMAPGSSTSVVSVKLDAGSVKDAVDAVTALWKNFSPNQPIRYTFLDESFATMYDDVLKTQIIFAGFAILAVIIACLGLFALSAFMSEQRSKEIGIRKVLGATVAHVTSLLSKEFLKLVLIAFVIASPVAWWVMSKWLEDFPYRVDITASMFLFAGAAAVVIALLTVSAHAIKAAVANPVKTLRSE